MSQKLKKEINEIKFYEKNLEFKDIINKSKILVCTSPETTFTLSMLSGSPTILLLEKNIFKLLNPKFTILIRELIKSKILFTMLLMLRNILITLLIIHIHGSIQEAQEGLGRII